MLTIGTKRGLIFLYLSHRQIMQLKRELFRYEGYWMGKDPSVINRDISTKEMAWDFKKGEK